MGGFTHWFNVEYWAVSWPNIFAPSLWTLLGILASHVHSEMMHNKRQDEIMGRSK